MPTEYFEQRERALLGPRYEQLYAAPQEAAERGVTVSALRAMPEQFAQKADFPLEVSPFCKAAFVVHAPEFKPGRHPYHHAGVFYSQEPSASSAAPLLGVQPGMRVLDLCAAPGGKSATLAQYMENKGTLVSCDAAQNRLTLVGGALERLGVACGRVLHNDAAVYNEAFAGADAVLCDVPCSGLGVLAKKPDIRQKTLDGLDGLVRLQRAILETAARYVRPGGRLVYSTCTLNPDENAGIVRPFLKEHPEFRTRSVECVLPGTTKDDDFLTLYPFRTGTDGFFIASLERL